MLSVQCISILSIWPIVKNGITFYGIRIYLGDQPEWHHVFGLKAAEFTDVTINVLMDNAPLLPMLVQFWEMKSG